MAMSDCDKCWDTPCTCGWDYRTWHVEALEQHVQMLQYVISWRKEHPDDKFSNNYNDSEPEGDRKFRDYINARTRNDKS